MYDIGGNPFKFLCSNILYKSTENSKRINISLLKFEMKHFEGLLKLLKYRYSGLDLKNIFCKKNKIKYYFPSADGFKNY